MGQFCFIIFKSNPSFFLASNASLPGFLVFASNPNLDSRLSIQSMVCLGCLLLLFLVPIINILPILFYYVMGKVYRLFGWEYRKPERAHPACPYKPAAKRGGQVEANSVPDPVESVKP